MKRFGLMVMCIGALIVILVPIAPASAHHVCSTTAIQPTWYNERVFLVMGTSYYRCSWDQTAVRVESQLTRYNSATNRWVPAAYADNEVANSRSVWASATGYCGSSSEATLRTEGRGLALYHTSYTDVHEHVSSSQTFQCPSVERIKP